MINTRLSLKLVRRTAAFVAAIVLGIVGPQPLQGEEDEPIPPGECGDNKMCTYYRYLQWARDGQTYMCWMYSCSMGSWCCQTYEAD